MKIAYLILLLFFITAGCSKKDEKPLPVAPTELTASLDVEKSTINLSWTDNSTNEAGFRIEQKIVGGIFLLIGETIAEVTTFTSAVKYNTDYVYRVYAYNAAGKSLIYTNEISAKIVTQVPTVIAEQPSNRTVNSTTYNAKVNAHNLPTTVTFEYGLGHAFNLSAEATPHFVTGNTLVSIKADIQGLNPSYDYYYRVKAVNALGTTYSETIFSPTWGLGVKYNIGQQYGGGIIFYVDKTGLHGLIAATGDQSSGVPWYSKDYNFNKSTESVLGTGSTNTTTIINFQGNTGTYAAKICRDYRGGAYSDWFLPSKDELDLLYLHKSIVGNFSNNYYWSSTEDGAGSDVIFIRGFGQGQSRTFTKFYESFPVRAIRAF